MRCFLAIDFPARLRKQFSEIQAKLREDGPDVKWVNVHQIHLTLCFFKSLRSEEVQFVSKQLREELDHFGTFELALRGVGSFPPSRDPKVIWIGIEDSIKLVELYRIIQKSALPFSEGDKRPGKEEPYLPHVTIGRVKSNRNILLLKKRIRELSDEPVGSCPVNQIIFFESRLNQGGPEYIQIDHFPL